LLLAPISTEKKKKIENLLRKKRIQLRMIQKLKK